MDYPEVGSEAWLSALTVPKYAWGDPRIQQRLHDELPVVITNSGIAAAAQEKWTISYLTENSLPGNTFSVYTSPNPYFRFYEAGKNLGRYEWASEMRMSDMSFPAFAALFRRHVPAPCDLLGDGAAPLPPSPDDPPFVYLQQALYAGVHPAVADDFSSFKWTALLGTGKSAGWGELTSNVLFIGQQGVITPPHYDEQHNLFLQLRGRKVFRLLHPKYFRAMRPFPVGHPADRQSQLLDVRKPDPEKFPRFPEAEFETVVVEAGEVLYIPSYYWHQVESPWEPTMSLSSWFKCGPTPTPSLPLRDPYRLVVFSRNIEKLVGGAIGYPAAATFFRKLMNGSALTPAECGVKEKLSGILLEMLAPSDVPTFLRELLDGRFGLTQMGGDVPLPSEGAAAFLALK